MNNLKPIVIDGFQKGIGDSPHVGFADMRNIDIYSEPGVARVNYILREWTYNNSTQDADGSTTFTADAAANTVTTASGNVFLHDYNNTSFAIPVTVSSSGTLPAGLAASTVYYIFGQSDSTTFKLASTYALADAGTAIDITDAGTGTHTMTAVKPGEIKHIITDPGTGYHYALDTNGRVWKTQGTNWFVISGNTLTSQSANGLAIWKNYLFVFRNTTVDVISLTNINTNATWSNSWKTDLTSGVHHAIHGQDDILYIANDRYVASLQELTTFDPSNAATFTWTTNALDLPAGYKVQRLAELGTFLMIGAYRENINESKIFPWDRSSTTFNLPLTIADGPLGTMQVFGNQLYVSAGNLGTVWKTNTAQVGFAFRIPPQMFGESRNANGGIKAMCIHQDRLFCAVSSSITSGIYSFNPSTGAIVLEYRVSTGTYASSSNPLRLLALLSVHSDQLIAAWYDSVNAKGGIDSTYVSNQNRNTSYSSYLISPLFTVGSNLLKRTFEQIEFILADDLASGEGIRLSYRKAASGNFTTIGTFDYATYGAIKSYNYPAGIVDAEVLQIKAELTTPGTNGVTSTPKLLNITLL